MGWSHSSNQKGFSYPELIVLMGVVAMLFGYITINLSGTLRRTTIDTTYQTLISDIKSQQTKAMTGSIDGGLPGSHGIYFESNRYILFRGTTYSSTDPSNFPVNLEQNVEFGNITFPGSTIVFLPGSGEISGYINGNNTVTVVNIGGEEQKTITINRYGAVTSAN